MAKGIKLETDYKIDTFICKIKSIFVEDVNILLLLVEN